MFMDLAISVMLVLFAGAMSGLTLGLLSLDVMQLRVMANSTEPGMFKYFFFLGFLLYSLFFKVGKFDLNLKT